MNNLSDARAGTGRGAHGLVWASDKFEFPVERVARVAARSRVSVLGHLSAFTEAQTTCARQWLHPVTGAARFRRQLRCWVVKNGSFEGPLRGPSEGALQGRNGARRRTDRRGALRADTGIRSDLHRGKPRGDRSALILGELRHSFREQVLDNEAHKL